jgi:hypothetical protein
VVVAVAELALGGVVVAVAELALGGVVVAVAELAFGGVVAVAELADSIADPAGDAFFHAATAV